MHKLAVGSLLLLSIFVLIVALCEAKTVSLRHSHHKDGALTIIIDMGGEGKKSKDKETTKKTKETKEEQPKLDDTTKEIVSKVSTTISKEEEKKLAEGLLTLGNELTQIAKLIPGKDSEQKLLKDQFLSIASEMAKESEKPSLLILQSSMKMVVQEKQNEQNADGAQTMFVGAVIEGLSLGMNAIDGIGTYSTSVSKIGNWVSGKAADKLDKWGLKSVASVARNTGKSIDGYAQKVAPYEKRLAEKIAPVVKSKTFQGVKRVANVVGGVLSVHAGIKFLGMSAATKLPKTFAAVKAGITKAAKLVANKGGIVRNIAATAIKAKRAATGSLKQYSAFRKVSTAIKGAKAAKGAAKVAHGAAHGHSKFKTALHHAHAGYEIYSGSNHIKHGIKGHHGAEHGSGHGSGHGNSGHGSSSKHSSGHGSSSGRKSSTGHSNSSTRPTRSSTSRSSNSRQTRSSPQRQSTSRSSGSRSSSRPSTSRSTSTRKPTTVRRGRN